jgi:hypothetical protein
MVMRWQYRQRHPSGILPTGKTAQPENIHPDNKVWDHPVFPKGYWQASLLHRRQRHDLLILLFCGNGFFLKA